MKANGRTVSDKNSPRIGVDEICQRLKIGRRTAYALLEGKIIPSLRVGNRYLIGRGAYLKWEMDFGHQRKGAVN